MSVGLKIARRGKDVDSSNQEDIIFDSTLGNLMVYKIYKYKAHWLSRDILVSNELGYAPFIMVFYNNGSVIKRWKGYTDQDTYWDDARFIFNLTSDDQYTYYFVVFTLPLEMDINNIITNTKSFKKTEMSVGIRIIGDDEDRFSSAYANLGVVKKYVLKNAPSGTSTISHNLGKYPTFTAFYKDNNDNFHMVPELPGMFVYATKNEFKIGVDYSVFPYISTGVKDVYIITFKDTI